MLQVTNLTREWLLSAVAKCNIGKELYLSLRRDYSDFDLDDLKAEVTLVLCELDYDKLVGLIARKEIIFYVIGIIQNMAMSSTSGYYCKYIRPRKMTVEYGVIQRNKDSRVTEDYSLPRHYFKNKNPFEYMANDKPTPKEYIDTCAAIGFLHSQLYWYDKDMLTAYANLGSLQNVTDKIGIPKSNVARVINRVKKQIKAQIKETVKLVEYVNNNDVLDSYGLFLS